MFNFGKNWQSYIRSLSDQKIAIAQKSLQHFLEFRSLKRKKILDVGSGSGILSLAARKLGADVVSFDIDTDSVECTKMVKNKYFPSDNHWRIIKGSLLDSHFVNGLGKFDIVYCWGVAHHTGNLSKALSNLASPVKKNGYLYLAIYNDQGNASIRWRRIKYTYNQLSSPIKQCFLLTIIIGLELLIFIRYLIRFRVRSYFIRWKEYGTKSGRGMNRWNDYVDWIGGYPFEVAKPEVIFDFYKSLGFELLKIKTCGGGSGNNEYVFKKK